MFDALPIPFDCELEVADTVFRERVSSALKDNNIWTVGVDNDVGYFLENIDVVGIIDPLSDGNICTVVPANTFSNRLHFSCSGEKVIFILMET